MFSFDTCVKKKCAKFCARRASRSGHDWVADVLKTHAILVSSEQIDILARGRLYNRTFEPRSTITLDRRSLMFYIRHSRYVTK